MTRFDEARAKDITSIIRYYNVEVSQSGYFKCPFCDTKRKDSGAIKNNRFKCFHCGAGGSTIDFVARIENINPINAVNKILDDKLTVDNYNPVIEAEKCIKNDILKNMILKNSRLISRCPEGIKYFEDRGITKALDLINKDQLQIKYNEYSNYKSIIYRFKKHDFIIQKSIEKNIEGRRYVRNFGNVHPVILTSYDHNKFMIVEGIEDALTTILLGYNCIVLNSVQNINKLIDLLETNKEWAMSNNYLLCLDNDNAGNEGMKKISDYFSSIGLQYWTSKYRKQMIKYNNKDINDYYIKNILTKEGKK